MVLDLSKYRFDAAAAAAEAARANSAAAQASAQANSAAAQANAQASPEIRNNTANARADAQSKAQTGSGTAEGERSARKRASDDGPGAKRPKSWPGPLPPILEPGLKLVFVGFNPGVESGRRGHYYAHGSNRFWKMLFWSGLTSTLHSTADDRRMPELYGYGFTDLVARCTKGIQQLSKQEMAEGVDLLDARLAEVQPGAVCLVGKGIWEAIAKSRGWSLKEFRYGHDPAHTFGGSQLYCVPSTSGLNSISADKQLTSWAELRENLLAGPH